MKGYANFQLLTISDKMVIALIMQFCVCRWHLGDWLKEVFPKVLGNCYKVNAEICVCSDTWVGAKVRSSP